MKAQPPARTLGRLEQLEQTVRDGLHTFVAVGMALAEIRDTSGYQLRGFATFEAYCQETFGFGARQGRRMTRAAATSEAVRQAVGVTLERESTARVLAPIADQPEALRQVKSALEARALRLAHAPAAAVAAAVRAAIGAAPAPAPIVRTGDTCPGCGRRPDSYRLDGAGARCGLCGTAVTLAVYLPRARARPGHCACCGLAFDGDNPRAGALPCCTLCDEEVRRRLGEK